MQHANWGRAGGLAPARRTGAEAPPPPSSYQERLANRSGAARRSQTGGGGLRSGDRRSGDRGHRGRRGRPRIRDIRDRASRSRSLPSRSKQRFSGVGRCPARTRPLSRETAPPRELPGCGQELTHFTKANTAISRRTAPLKSGRKREETGCGCATAEDAEAAGRAAAITGIASKTKIGMWRTASRAAKAVRSRGTITRP